MPLVGGCAGKPCVTRQGRPHGREQGQRPPGLMSFNPGRELAGFVGLFEIMRYPLFHTHLHTALNPKSVLTQARLQAGRTSLVKNLSPRPSNVSTSGNRREHYVSGSIGNST